MEYFFLSLSSAAVLITFLAPDAARSFVPFGRIKRQPQAWWFPEVEETVREKRKAFVAAHKGDEYRQTYISASRHASSVIAKAKAEAWQMTCSFLSPKSVYSLLRSVAGFSFSSHNFPNCSSPKESGSIKADYLRSHFYVSQPKVLRNRVRGYLFELHRTTCFKSLTLFLLSLPPCLISRVCHKPYLVHYHTPRQSCLTHAKTPSSL